MNFPGNLSAVTLAVTTTVSCAGVEQTQDPRVVDMNRIAAYVHSKCAAESGDFPVNSRPADDAYDVAFRMAFGYRDQLPQWDNTVDDNRTHYRNCLIRQARVMLRVRDQRR